MRREIENGISPTEFVCLIQNIGGKALCETLADLEEESWLSSKNTELESSIPFFVSQLIPKTRRKEIIPFFEKWLKKSSISDELFLKIYKCVLGECYNDNLNCKDLKNQKKFDQDFVQDSKCLLAGLVRKKELNPCFFTKQDDDETIQCGFLIFALETCSDYLDYCKIRNNLQQFPNIRDLIIDELMRKIKENEKNSPNGLLRALNKDLSKISKSYLCNIECIIEKLKKEPKIDISTFKSKLKNDTQTLDTVSEINLLGLLLEKSFKIKGLEVKAGKSKKNFDALIETDGKQLYVEVFNPRRYLPLDFFGGAYHIPDKIRGKIEDKYEKFSKLSDGDIAILAIDETEHFIVESDIKKVFSTSLKKNHKLERLCAVLLFDSSSCKRLILNENAKSQLPKHISEKIDPDE